jgi:hypothetical protein
LGASEILNEMKFSTVLTCTFLTAVVTSEKDNGSSGNTIQCSREDSRLVRNFLHHQVFQSGKISSFSSSCPLRPKTDIYAEQEINKLEQYRGEYLVEFDTIPSSLFTFHCYFVVCILSKEVCK